MVTCSLAGTAKCPLGYVMLLRDKKTYNLKFWPSLAKRPHWKKISKMGCYRWIANLGVMVHALDLTQEH